MNKIVSFAVLSTIALTALPASAEIILDVGCYMGGVCYQKRYHGKTFLEQGEDGRLFSVETSTRSIHNEEGGRVSAFGPRETSYVYCSTTRPTHIFSFDDVDGYTAQFLNPGSPDSEYSFERGSYPVYWTTCHNLVGPVFFSEAMTRRASNLGYSLRLPINQIDLSNPRDILSIEGY